jgi:hypothetical protein
MALPSVDPLVGAKPVVIENRFAINHFELFL